MTAGHGVHAVRVAVIADMVEEGWPSMDLVAEMLMDGLRRDEAVHAALVRAPLRRRLSRPDGNGRLLTVDRIVNRYWDYGRWLRAHAPQADVHHIVDHSYAHLAAGLPAGRVVVTCHDTDAFRTVLMPGQRESSLPQPLVRRTLRGLQRAAVVACGSVTTRDELVRHEAVDPSRLVVVPYGVHPACSDAADPEADAEAARLLARLPGDYLLHVGSAIPRKRLDLLIEAFSRVARDRPAVTLVRAGGDLTAGQRALAARLGLEGRLVELPFVSRRVLSAVYRRAALVVLPSDREGFGLPLVEAMACGTPVLASDVAVLKEVGGDAVEYCAAGDAVQWHQAIGALLDERQADPERWQARRRAGLSRASRFSWASYAEGMAAIYRRVADAHRDVGR